MTTVGTPTGEGRKGEGLQPFRLSSLENQSHFIDVCVEKEKDRQRKKQQRKRNKTRTERTGLGAELQWLSRSSCVNQCLSADCNVTAVRESGRTYSESLMELKHIDVGQRQAAFLQHLWRGVGRAKRKQNKKHILELFSVIKTCYI